MSQKIFLGDDLQEVSILEPDRGRMDRLVSMGLGEQRSLAVEEQAEKRIQGFITYVL